MIIGIEMVFDAFKDGIDAVLHPDKVARESKTVGEALLWYYKFSVIPLVLLLIVALGAGFALNSVALRLGLTSGLLGGSLLAAAVAAVLVYVWGLLPLGLLIYAVVLDWVGNALKTFKNNYSDTLVAVIYGTFAPLSVLWLSVLPVIGGLIQLVALIWSLYVVVVILANKNKSTRVEALVTVVAGGILTWIIVAILAQFVLTGIFGLTLGPLVGAGATLARFGSGAP